MLHLHRYFLILYSPDKSGRYCLLMQHVLCMNYVTILDSTIQWQMWKTTQTPRSIKCKPTVATFVNTSSRIDRQNVPLNFLHTLI